MRWAIIIRFRLSMADDGNIEAFLGQLACLLP